MRARHASNKTPKISWRKWLILPGAIAMQSCTQEAVHSFVQAAPKELIIASADLATEASARADDGCAFSGTWKFHFSLKQARIDGWLIFDVESNPEDSGNAGTVIRGAIDWDLRQNAGLSGSYHERVSFYLFDRVKAPVRSLSTTAYVIYQDDRTSQLREMPVEFVLDPDGVSMAFRYIPTSSLTPKWQEGRATKVRAARCGEREPYVDAVKMGLEHISGVRLPP